MSGSNPTVAWRPAAGDRVTLSWVGSRTGPYTDFIPVTAATAGHALEFDVPAAQIAGNATVTVSYTVDRSGIFLYSAALTLRVGDAAALPAPSIKEADGDTLDVAAAAGGATVVVPAGANLTTGDLVTVTVTGTDGDHGFEHPVSAAQAGQEVTVTVPADVIAASAGGTLTVGYAVARGAGGTETSDSATWTVTQAAVARAAGGVAQSEVLTLKTALPQTVTGSHAGQSLTFTLPYVVLQAADGGSLTLSYSVSREATGKADASPDTKYSEGHKLKIMGARSQWQNSGSLGSCPLIRHLVALDGRTYKPIVAIWRYEGETEMITGSRFIDLKPERKLHVNAGKYQVTLNASNLNGNNDTIVALRDDGSIVLWGKGGNDIHTDISSLTDIVGVAAGTDSFAFLRLTGQIVSWGDEIMGGIVPPDIATLTDIISISANSRAYAALRATGQVVAWGELGGVVPEEVAKINDIISLTGGAFSFAALRSTGQVVTWNNGSSGALPAKIARLTDIISVVANSGAFAALRSSGQVVTWGDVKHGGQAPAAITSLTDVVEVIPGDLAFAARRANGAVVAWGEQGMGGDMPDDISSLKDIKTVTANLNAFTALRESGQVVAWGNISGGGQVPETISALTDIVQLTGVSSWFANNGSFAALRADGTVVAWGKSTAGSINEALSLKLSGVRAVYTSGNDVFAALTGDGEVITWGDNNYGADSSKVQPLLTHKINYETVLN